MDEEEKERMTKIVMGGAGKPDKTDHDIRVVMNKNKKEAFIVTPSVEVLKANCELLETIKKLEEENVKVQIISASDAGIPESPFFNPNNVFPITCFSRMENNFDPNLQTPNKLLYLKSLELSIEQIDYIKNSPDKRMENESQKDYKERRILNKLIIKYRGLF